MELMRETSSTLEEFIREWQPLTHDEEIAVNPDWVVSIVEPILSVLEAYGQTLKPVEEAKAVFGTDVNTEPNLSITDTDK